MRARLPIYSGPDRETSNVARPDDADAAADLGADRARGSPSWRCRDRVASGRRRCPPLYVSRTASPRKANGQRTRSTRHCPQRPRGNARLEWSPAHGALLCRVRRGQRAAYDQSAAASGADRMDRQSCRRSSAVLRPDILAADRGGCTCLQDGQALGAAHRPGAYAGGKIDKARAVVLRRFGRR